ncbi:MAG TPA: GNAT family N-acetyltransferase [Thermomicrobiales bacterium]|nr:GNAT family N-acetyltransferase [Thermomicrobiales bacterium]
MVELVPIREADRDELREVVRRYWIGLMPHAPVVQDPARGEVEFRSRFRLDDAESLHWWAVLDGIRIGFAKVDLAEENGERSAQVRDFYVEPEWRRRGYGRAFARAMIGWLREQGVGQIDLNVRRDNPVALAFWRSLGFDLALYHLRRYL